MTKFFILYWQPGSCGDLIQSLLLSNNAQIAGVLKSFDLKNDRVIPSIDPIYLSLFPALANEWYHREWSQSECSMLTNLCQTQNIEYFIIPTHNFASMKFLHNTLYGSSTIGVTYQKNLFPFVLKNWCKKTLSQNTNLTQDTENKIHWYAKQKKVYAEFVFKQQLLYGSKIAKEEISLFDFPICLEKILLADLSDVKKIFPCSTIDLVHYHNWLDRQNILFKYKFEINESLKNVLGHNTLSNLTCKDDYQLDLYDKILIKTFLHDINTENIDTLYELDNLMKFANCDN